MRPAAGGNKLWKRRSLSSTAARDRLVRRARIQPLDDCALRGKLVLRRLERARPEARAGEQEPDAEHAGGAELSENRVDARLHGESRSTA